MHCRDFRLLTAPVTLAAPMPRAVRQVRLPAPGRRQLSAPRARSVFLPAASAVRAPALLPEG